MELIDGKKIGNKILFGLEKKLRLKEKEKEKLLVAVILVGRDPVSSFYLKVKEKKFKRFGIKIKKCLFEKSTPEEKIIRTISRLNKNKKVKGIIIELPFPPSFSASKIISSVSPEKDVDGLLEKSRFQSPFILAIWQTLKTTGQDLENKKITALVNSKIFGERLKKFFRRKGLTMDYLFTKDKKFKSKIKKTDVLITAIGKPNFIKENMLKKGVIIIDGGISINKKGKEMKGDVELKSASKKCSWLAPVPSGVGQLTTAFLIKNILLAENSKPTV